MSRAKRNRKKERQRRALELERRARDLFVGAPLERLPDEDLNSHARRIRNWTDQTYDRVFKECGEDAQAILDRIQELNREKSRELLAQQHLEGAVRPEDLLVVATAAVSFVLQGADVRAMLRRHEELCRQVGAPVIARVRVNDERVCVFRHPEEFFVRMWLFGEYPEDEYGSIFHAEEAN